MSNDPSLVGLVREVHTAAEQVDAALTRYLDLVRQLRACARAAQRFDPQVVVHPPLPVDPVTGQPVKRGRGRPKGAPNRFKHVWQ